MLGSLSTQLTNELTLRTKPFSRFFSSVVTCVDFNQSVLNINLSVGEQRKIRAGEKIRINENLAICKGMRIPEYGTFFLVESKILGFNSIRNPTPGIQTFANNFKPGRNPSSSDKESGIFHRYSESEIHRVEFRIQDCLGQTYTRRRIAVPLYQKQRTKKQAEKGRNNITYNSNFLTFQCLLFCDLIQWQETVSQS